MDKNYRELMTAIMNKAVNDYKEKTGINSCKSFFNSEWCNAICDALNLSINGKQIMKKLDGGTV